MLLKKNNNKYYSGFLESQIIIFTKNIKKINIHIKNNNQDYNAKKSLICYVNKRKKILNYLKDKNFINYNKLLNILNIKKT